MTTENNKLIAEFLGAKQYDKTDDFIYFDETNNIFSNDTISLKNLKFHNDWNWLMEVVEKIENLEFYPKNSTCIGFDSFGIEINKNRCDITRYGDFTHLLLQGQGGTRIEAVYNACVTFIKWYNEKILKVIANKTKNDFGKLK